MDPPLSVDAEGRFLRKKSLSQQSNVRTAAGTNVPEFSTSVEYAVIAMLVVAFVAICGTLAGLGGTQVVCEGLRCLEAFLENVYKSPKARQRGSGRCTRSCA